MKRYFEFVEGSSSKFWEIAQNGTDVTVRFGRIGTNGQSQTKTLADAAAATKHVEKLVKEKTAKGYRETTAK
jgi:predicted DNA-binding WGR domain protein